MNNIISYFEQNIGILPEIQALPESKTGKLPYYLKNSYDLYKIRLNERDFVLAENRGEEISPPEQLNKQAEQLRNLLGYPVIFAFVRLESYFRKRLVEKKIAFVVPFRQMYIPYLFIDLREIKDKPIIKREKLWPATQALLLYHLQVENLSNLKFQEIAQKLSYSNMTISRAVKELVNAGLCKIAGRKEKELDFFWDKKDLWTHALPYLTTPVKQKFFVDPPPPVAAQLKAGDSALASYTYLVERKNITCAMGKDGFQNWYNASHTKINYIEGSFALEIWNYAPILLAKGDAVDRLSLYLSMKDHADERIQIALENLIEDMPW